MSGRGLALATAAIVATACGAGPHTHTRGGPPPAATGTAITLYRDLALIQQRIEVDVPTAGAATPTAILGAGVTLSEVAILDQGELVTTALHAADAAPVRAGAAAAEPGDPIFGAGGDDEDDSGSLYGPLPPPDADATPAPAPAPAPVKVQLEATAPHAGHYALTLAYVTDRVTWDAAYTMTTTPERSLVDARGAIAIRNGAGIAFPGAHVTVVDEALGTQRDHLAERIAATATGHKPDDPDTHPARPHDLGVLDLGDGEVRAELYPPGATRALRSVLVYDPVGTKLDNPAPLAVRDENLGVTPPAPTRVTESVEIVRDATRDLGLPDGGARLIERRPDGSLAVLADGRMFDSPTRVATFDTIALGVARDVLGHRARRDFNLDDDRRRLTEDFAIEVDNQRAHPVQVVMLEHMYRSANWALGFNSVPAELDGTQEISMRTEVPANSKAQVLYVVVYWWDEPK